VKIPKGPEALLVADLGLPEGVIVDDYFIQRFEVTNRDYKKFMDAGGYRRKEYWQQEFKDNGRTLTWEDAMTRLRDKA
ncbi:SUMF1/EgtB/PvdO family nonheme iron enzyme, partial [Salmonella sp. SAL4435]|uniref:SUMF1/EgtB/PvdO family nonheme iron enzyme n=1 Tax=Salmonella sp. SAL4435 TaxID=3159890 RepID=UPI00397AC4A7